MIPQSLIKLLASVFYLGYIPVMPGTFGSLAGLMMYLLVGNNHTLYISATILAFLLGLFISHPAEDAFCERDSRKIVIDELCGMMLTYLFIPFSIKRLFAGFLLFRLFDILKPPPLRRLHMLPGGFGVMMDDIGAGLYSNLILRIICAHSLL